MYPCDGVPEALQNFERDFIRSTITDILNFSAGCSSDRDGMHDLLIGIIPMNRAVSMRLFSTTDSTILSIDGVNGVDGLYRHTIHSREIGREIASLELLQDSCLIIGCESLAKQDKHSKTAGLSVTDSS